jgi:hypothetical protein
MALIAFIGFSRRGGAGIAEMANRFCMEMTWTSGFGLDTAKAAPEYGWRAIFDIAQLNGLLIHSY